MSERTPNPYDLAAMHKAAKRLPRNTRTPNEPSPVRDEVEEAREFAKNVHDLFPFQSLNNTLLGEQVISWCLKVANDRAAHIRTQERERAAKIAERMPQRWPGNEECWCACGENIAAAIREG